MSQTYDPLDPESQAQRQADAESKRRNKQDTEEQDFKWLMGSRRGRRIIWRTLERAGVFRLTFNTDAMLMAFAEGNRNEGLHTLQLIHAICPELYTTMVNEANERKHEHGDGSKRDNRG